jgi:hypothetical protein
MFGAHIAVAGETMSLFPRPFTGDQADVVDREDEQPAADDETHPAPGESEGHGDAHDGEYQTGGADRPLLVDLDFILVGSK